VRICILTVGRVAFSTPHYHKEAAALKAAGHDVSVIAPCGEMEDVNDPTLNYLRIEVIPLVRGNFDSRFRKLLALPRLYRLARRVACDAYQVMEVPSLAVGVALKLATGRRLVYDCREDYPRALAVNTGLPVLSALLVPLFTAFENLLVLATDRCFVVSEALLDRFIRLGRPTSLLLNLPRLDFASGATHRGKYGRPFEFIYTGFPEERVAMEEMIEGLGLARGLGANARLTFLGTSPDHPRATTCTAIARRLGIEGDVRFLPEVGYLDVPKLLSAADAGLIVYRANDYTRRFAHSVKMFEYMAVGLPVVCSDFPNLVRPIQEAGCGLLVDPGNPESIALAMVMLVTHPDEARRMGRNARHAFVTKFNWEATEGAYVSAMEKLAKRP